MRIHLSDKKQFKKTDSYGKKMSYTTTLFGGSYKQFQSLKKDDCLKQKYIIWYSK